MSSRSHSRFNTITKNTSSTQHPAHMLIIRPLPPGEWFTYIAIHSLIAFQNTKRTAFENEMTTEHWAHSSLDFVFDWRNDIMFPYGVAHVLYVTKSTIEIVCILSNGNNFIVTSMFECSKWNNCFGFVYSRTPHKYVRTKKWSTLFRYVWNECSKYKITKDV